MLSYIHARNAQVATRRMLSADLLQVDCQNLLCTVLLQVVSTNRNKPVNDSSDKPDFLQVNEMEKFVATSRKDTTDLKN